MEAMAMAYSVLDDRELADLKPGAHVDFTLVVEKERSHAQGIHIHRYESCEREPLLARRLKLLEAKFARRQRPLREFGGHFNFPRHRTVYRWR